MNHETLVHVGIIMDGNRRWARQHGLPVKDGHKEGVEALERVVREAVKNKINYLTVYALSTENLIERDKSEIGDLFSLIKMGFVSKLPILKREGVRVEFLGNIDKLPTTVKKILETAKRTLASGKNLQLNIAINYGSREEILKASLNVIDSKTVNEETFSQFLYTKNLPDPDLIIRTGGQKRLSNFLLWQAAYSELYFTDTLWPDFDEKDFLEALEDFRLRKRNFGI